MDKKMLLAGIAAAKALMDSQRTAPPDSRDPPAGGDADVAKRAQYLRHVAVSLDPTRAAILFADADLLESQAATIARMHEDSDRRAETAFYEGKRAGAETMQQQQAATIATLRQDADDLRQMGALIVELRSKLSDARGLLLWLDSRGGLGLDIHRHIRETLAKTTSAALADEEP